jgi:hypothetical protein
MYIDQHPELKRADPNATLQLMIGQLSVYSHQEGKPLNLTLEEVEEAGEEEEDEIEDLKPKTKMLKKTVKPKRDEEEAVLKSLEETRARILTRRRIKQMQDQIKHLEEEDRCEPTE